MKCFIILILLLSITTSYSYFLYSDYQDRKELSELGTIVLAKVTKKATPHKTRSDYGEDWELYYTFNVPSYPNTIFNNMVKVRKRLYDETNLNSKIVITYNQSDPSKSYLGDRTNTPFIGLIGLADILFFIFCLPSIVLCIIYCFWGKLIRHYKRNTFPTNNALGEEFDKITVLSNTRLRTRIAPLLVLLVVVITMALIDKSIDKYKLLQLAKNGIVTTATIIKKETIKESFQIDYVFSPEQNYSSQVEFEGTGRVSKNNFYKITYDSKIYITFNQDDPNDSRIGNISDLTLKKIVKTEFAFYIFLGLMWFASLWGIYYLLVKIRTQHTGYN